MSLNSQICNSIDFVSQNVVRWCDEISDGLVQFFNRRCAILRQLRTLLYLLLFHVRSKLVQQGNYKERNWNGKSEIRKRTCL